MIEWFVIYNNEHLGPFSEEVLRQLYAEGDVKADSMIWKEGMQHPISYEDQFILEKDQLEFKQLSGEKILTEKTDDSSDDLPPPLPPEAKSLDQNKSKDKDEAENKVAPLKTKETQKTEREPKSKKDLENTESASVKEKLDEIIDEQVIQEAIDIEKETKSNQRNVFIGLVILIILLIPGGVYLKNSYFSFSRPSQMSLKDYDRLYKLSTDPSFENKFAIALGQERAKLWLATNIPYEGEVTLKLSSIKDKTLTNKEIKVTAKAYLKDKVAQFDELTFTKGSKLVDGYYHVEAYTTKDLEVPFMYEFYPERKRQFRFFDELLISHLSKEDFSKALKQSKSRMTQNDLAFWEELKQKYLTIKMITVKIKNEINRAFNSKNVYWVEELKKFEDKYKREFGAFFTNFVIQNEQSYEKLKKKDFSNKIEIISNYNRLSRLAKEVGKVSMDIFHKMEIFDGIDEAQKKRIQQEADQKLSRIIKTCEEKIKMIQSL